MAKMLNANKFDLRGTLELLHTSTDLNMQVKLLSMLSAYLLLKDSNTVAVITCKYIYDKISKILSNSPPRKAAVVLNFLSALLYVDEELSKKNLALYAKNMIRVSGCLANMCELFTSSMMYQDTWRALCCCLAETCREFEANQSYCTHLVPMCIQRCSQHNVEAFAVLTSLLQNHNRNIQLFINSNGASLFTRDLLQYEVCLELLVTLVQSSSQAAILIGTTNVCEHLRDFLQLYGPRSQLGQWATIILYHTSRVKEPSTRLTDIELEVNQKLEQTFPKNNQQLEGNDTVMLFQNVVKEILQWEPKRDFKNLQKFLVRLPNWDQEVNTKTATEVPYLSENGNSRLNNKNNYYKDTVHRYPGIVENNISSKNKHLQGYELNNNLSFSFLQKQKIPKNILSNFTCFEGSNKIHTQEKNPDKNATTQKLSSDVLEATPETNIYVKDVNNFKPKFTSTPKCKKNKIYREQTSTTVSNSAIKINKNSFKITKRPQSSGNKKRIAKKKYNQDLCKIDKELKNRSFSARFFEAINESCTTLVKTVKNIFVSKKTPINNDNSTSLPGAGQQTLPCNYSFTNYMRKRDAVLLNETNKRESEVFSFQISNSCNSCNDTAVLKHKLASDKYLKHTVKKLKLGINLYGCDFKKISRNLWPQETYMTPAVLYNLYRKLIIK